MDRDERKSAVLGRPPGRARSDDPIMLSLITDAKRIPNPLRTGSSVGSPPLSDRPPASTHAADPDDDSSAAIAARTDFGDLEAQDGVCEIQDTARRSMALTQLIKTCEHLERRLSPSWSCFGTIILGKRWVVGRMGEGGGYVDYFITSGQVSLRSVMEPSSVLCHVANHSAPCNVWLTEL